MQKLLNKKMIIGLLSGISIVVIATLLLMNKTTVKSTTQMAEQNIKTQPAMAKNVDLKNLQQQGFWYDQEKKLLWFRCHIGQKFENNQCIGKIESYDFLSAQNEVSKLNQTQWQGQNTWRLPEISELYGLIHCSTGFIDQTHLDQKQLVQHGCKPTNYQRPTIDLASFPATQTEWYWSATAYQTVSVASDKKVWGAYLSSGYVYDLNPDNKGYVYIVSSIQP